MLFPYSISAISFFVDGDLILYHNLSSASNAQNLAYQPFNQGSTQCIIFICISLALPAWNNQSKIYWMSFSISSFMRSAILNSSHDMASPRASTEIKSLHRQVPVLTCTIDNHTRRFTHTRQPVLDGGLILWPIMYTNSSCIRIHIPIAKRSPIAASHFVIEGILHVRHWSRCTQCTVCRLYLASFAIRTTHLQFIE